MKGIEARFVALAGLVTLAASVAVLGGTRRGEEAVQVKGTARSEAVEAIDRLGGTYAVKFEGSPEFQTIVKRLGYDERAYYDIRQVNLGPVSGAAPVGDADFGSLAERLALFTHLKILDLRGNRISDRGIAALPPLPNLAVIRLSGMGITDGIADVLQRFPSLTALELEESAVTDAGVEKIQRLLPACKVSR